MYAVIRFQNTRQDVNLVAISESLNCLVPGSFTGLDRAPNRFSCSLSSDDDWVLQRQAVFDFVSRCGSVIRDAQLREIRVEIDLAFGPSEGKGVFVTEIDFDLELIELLNRWGISFVVSIYGEIESEAK